MFKWNALTALYVFGFIGFYGATSSMQSTHIRFVLSVAWPAPVVLMVGGLAGKYFVENGKGEQ